MLKTVTILLLQAMFWELILQKFWKKMFVDSCITFWNWKDVLKFSQKEIYFSFIFPPKAPKIIVPTDL